MLGRLSKRLSLTGAPSKRDAIAPTSSDAAPKKQNGSAIPEETGQKKANDGHTEVTTPEVNGAAGPIQSSSAVATNGTSAPKESHPAPRFVEEIPKTSPIIPSKSVPTIVTTPPTPKPSTPNVFTRLLSTDNVKWPNSPTEPVAVRKLTSRAEKNAHTAALMLRTFIVGPSRLAVSSTPALSKAEVKKLRASLLKPDEANRIIAHLRMLPSHPDHEKIRAASGKLVDMGVAPTPAPPIHAACLSVTDEEAERLHFSKLYAIKPSDMTTPAENPSKVALPSTLPVLSPASLSFAIGSLNLISLVTAPDMGFGHPASDPGMFAGAVPSAEEIGNGVEELAKALLALGFAGSGMVWPDHAGVYPPEDRISCYTYWWGYELVLPHRSVVYLSKCKSVSDTLLNFLTVLSMFEQGVREILPFIRYIAQFADLEFGAIQAQDKGQGVVCAATWVVPVALVPRPWDFAPRPPNAPKPPVASEPAAPEPDSTQNGAPAAVDAPKPPAPASNPPPLASLPPVAISNPQQPIINKVPITPPTVGNGTSSAPHA